LAKPDAKYKSLLNAKDEPGNRKNFVKSVGEINFIAVSFQFSIVKLFFK